MCFNRMNKHTQQKDSDQKPSLHITVPSNIRVSIRGPLTSESSPYIGVPHYIRVPIRVHPYIRVPSRIPPYIRIPISIPPYIKVPNQSVPLVLGSPLELPYIRVPISIPPFVKVPIRVFPFH